MSVARLFADNRAHNATVAADRQADSCDCPMCRAGYGALNTPLTDAERIATGLEPADPVSPGAAPAGETSAAVLASPADARRPVQRGPVQDESRFRDPGDVQVHLGGDDLPLIDDVGGGP